MEAIISGFLKIFAAMIILAYYLSGGIIIFLLISPTLIFKKAGIEPWKALIPFYNVYLFNKIAWNKEWKKWYIIVLLLPIINKLFFSEPSAIGNYLKSIFILFEIITLYKLSKSFNQSNLFTIGVILLPWIFIPILAFNNNKQYIENTSVSNDITNIENNYNVGEQSNDNIIYCPNCGTPLSNNMTYCPNCGTPKTY